MLGNLESVLSPKSNTINRIYHADPRVQAKKSIITFFASLFGSLKHFKKALKAAAKTLRYRRKN